MNNFKGGFKKGGGNFGDKPKFGGGRSDGGRKFGGGGHRGGDKAPQRFQATCATCKKSCEVPFRPSGDKPVYCSDCFSKKSKDDSRDDRGVHGRNERPDHAKSHRDERPSRQDTGLIDIKRQLTAIESRLNRILDLINPPVPAVKAAQVVKVNESERKTVNKATKKVVDKSALKKVVAKATKTPAPKKVVKKVAAKKTAKKVVKKVAKKVTKKTSK